MKVGIIGGSGVYEMAGLTDVGEHKPDTPFGAPSDAYVGGKLAGREVFFLPRHGRGHRIMPSEINHRANVYGFKLLGVERVISISAVGSLREELRPRDIVLPDQYYDRTKKSLEHTFFGRGMVAHISFGSPTCSELREVIAASAATVLTRGNGPGVRVVNGGTYVNMEGPAFSTRSESNVYRKLGFDVVGMTSLAEAKLCREAEICYQSLAMVTDYDCWRESGEQVTVEMVLSHLRANTALAKEIVAETTARMPECRSCSCAHALENAILTDPKVFPPDVHDRLGAIIARHVKKQGGV